MDSEGTSLETQPVSESDFVPETQSVNQEELRRRQMAIAGLVAGVILLLALLVTAVIYLALPNTNTERIRDIMIIIMALEFMLLGIALMVLIVQLATLINLLQNEIIPIVESTNETANTLRGTTEFLSENLTEPVIKLNQYFAGFMKLTELIGLTRKK
jgi:hypothetical protein